ncbi:TIGR02679 domain-containing protein [Tepidibacillus sp. HK-1]|uniref:TIGR02679 domain-containing protein n=1 Tax=Tepidibacillus sp. HK-1 TaxID=1883407 RepID=UPI0008535810|nr:TIGR02679 domain-containing protein [Tepidibacillus sp. HK-1]GBF10900.1 hypothetical protein HK1_00916 [Tepidibacillus sp. HK-1]
MDKLNHLTSEAVKYFKQEKGFQTLFQLLINKYKSLGRIGGKVTIVNVNEQEKEVLSSFFRKDFSKEKSITIAFSQFEKALERTKFAGVDVKDLLDGYIGHPIISQAEEKERYERLKANFFEEFKQRYNDPLALGFLQHIQEKGNGVRGFHLAYDKDRDLFKSQLEQVIKAISILTFRLETDTRTKDYIRLPIFAYQVTQDPHGFDLDTDQGRFLIVALQWIRQLEDQDYEMVSSLTAEDVSELMQYFRIIRDDILNFVTCTGILGFCDDGTPESLWWEAFKGNHVMNVALRELIKLHFFIPGVTYHSRKANVVFVVENSGVFSAIIDQLQLQESPPIICTHGQFKLATLILLDYLVQNDVIIYYSGDYDPEGLQMAERLKNRYPEHVQLWHYEVDEYMKAKSTVELSDTRLKKLETITLSELQPLKEQIKIERKAGYQEKLIPKLIEDIEKMMEEC